MSESAVGVRNEAALLQLDPNSVTKFHADPALEAEQTIRKPANKKLLTSLPLIAITASSDGSLKLTVYDVALVVLPPTLTTDEVISRSFT